MLVLLKRFCIRRALENLHTIPPGSFKSFQKHQSTQLATLSEICKPAERFPDFLKVGCMRRLLFALRSAATKLAEGAREILCISVSSAVRFLFKHLFISVNNVRYENLHSGTQSTQIQFRGKHSAGYYCIIPLSVFKFFYYHGCICTMRSTNNSKHN